MKLIIKLVSISCFLFFTFSNAEAQSGCPGCIINVPSNMPEDTLFISEPDRGVAFQPYVSNISFRMPKTTTPVYALDSTTSPGLEIDQLEIRTMDNLPPGLNWEANQTSYTPASITDGCFKLCGVPTQFGLYEVLITVEASISIVSQTSTFPIMIEIVAPENIGDGFTMINAVGCGATEVSFFNNSPSNGTNGFTYFWDFGNGNTSFDENPGNQVYDQPGVYQVDFTVDIDTVGFILTNINVAGVSCTDFLGTPDMFIRIKNPNGIQIFESQVVSNTNPPLSFATDLLIEEGNYEIEVWDLDDGLLGGADDLCGSISFNQLSNGLLTAGDFSLNLSIIHPLSSIQVSDSVVVYPQPDTPTIATADMTTVCSGELVVLVSSYETGNQWFQDGELLSGANDDSLTVEEAGMYEVQYLSADGCTAISEPIEINFLDLPVIPFFNNENNLLFLVDSSFLPSNYSLQWFLNGEMLLNENGAEMCATEAGEYSLEVINEDTDCPSQYTLNVEIDDNFDCTVAVNELRLQQLVKVYPNPSDGFMQIEITEDLILSSPIRVINSVGQIVEQVNLNKENGLLNIDLSNMQAGLYFLNLQLNGKGINKKIILY